MVEEGGGGRPAYGASAQRLAARSVLCRLLLSVNAHDSALHYWLGPCPLARLPHQYPPCARSMFVLSRASKLVSPSHWALALPAAWCQRLSPPSATITAIRPVRLVTPGAVAPVWLGCGVVRFSGGCQRLKNNCVALNKFYRHH